VKKIENIDRKTDVFTSRKKNKEMNKKAPEYLVCISILIDKRFHKNSLSFLLVEQS
jgi:hypothetical protein